MALMAGKRSVKSVQAVDARWARAGRVVSLGATSLLLAGLAAFVYAGSPMLARQVARSLEAAPPTVRIAWPGGGEGAGSSGTSGTWFPPALQAELTALAEGELRAEADALSASTLARVAQALNATGWFARLDSIRRSAGGVVEVRGEWRVPAAVVRHGDHDYLVASGGELLPLRYAPGASNQRVILGVAAGPPAEGGDISYGVTWPGEDLQAALATLRLVAPRPWQAQVRAIDVSGFERSREVALVTAWGTRVVMAGHPARTQPGIKPAAVQLGRLDNLFRAWQRIDAGHRLIRVYTEQALVDDRPAGNS